MDKEAIARELLADACNWASRSECLKWINAVLEGELAPLRERVGLSVAIRAIQAALDRSATLSPAEPSPESREGVIEECAKVAEEYRGPPPLRHAGTCRGIASAIRALSAPAHD